MTRRNVLVRVCRALSGKTQKDYGEAVGVHPDLLAEHEMGVTEPSPETLERVTRGVGLTVGQAEEILRFADTLRRQRYRSGQGLDAITQPLAQAVAGVYQRLLRVPPPASSPSTGEQQQAEEPWARLKDLAEDEQWAVVTAVRDFQTRPLPERLREETGEMERRDPQRAVHLENLAREIEERSGGV